MVPTEKIVTPKGELRWVFITGKGKENLKGENIYCASLVLDGAEAEKLKNQILKFFEENKPKGVKKPKSTGFKELDDGSTEFYFWTTIQYPDGSPKIVKVFNAKALPIDLGEQKIGNGSIGRISGSMSIYEVSKGKQAGVTLLLDKIQVIKLVVYDENPFEEDPEGEFLGNAEVDFNAEEV